MTRLIDNFRLIPPLYGTIWKHSCLNRILLDRQRKKIPQYAENPAALWRTGFPLKIVICGFKPRESLELDGSAGFFELGLSLLSVFLLGLLQDSLRSAVDQSLGLSQTQGGDSADGLDDLDLLVANGGEDDVELILLFLSRSSSASIWVS